MTRQRVLTVKLYLKLKQPADKELYRRLVELSWQAMQYGNNCLRSWWAETAGLRIDPTKGDPHDISKHVRRHEKGELSGAAYSAVERETRGLVMRHGKRVLAGAPLPEFRIGKALAVRGHSRSIKESGVRLTFEHGQFVAHLQLQAATAPGGSWLVIPLAKHTSLDDYQAPMLHRMCSWETPIRKASLTIQRERGRVLLHLTYANEIDLPAVGERVATLGPTSREGMRLLLRTELETKDYSAKLATILARKRDWDGIRRRVMTQVGRRQGHARIKREALSRLTWEDWLDTYLHQWSFEMIAWCKTQGVGRLTLAPLGGGDWPADRLKQQLKYKGEDLGIVVDEMADASDAATARSLKQEASRQRRRSKKLGDSIREIQHQLNTKELED